MKTFLSHRVSKATPLFLLLTLALKVGFAQGVLKNNGTFVNTGTSTYTRIENFKTSAGTILNSGTLNSTTTFLNQSGGLNGKVLNYIGSGGGTINVTTNLDNNAAGAIFDNDSLTLSTVLRVGGSITNAGTFDTDTGKVEYNGAGVQTIIATTYGALVTSNASAKSIASGTTTVRDSIRIAGSSSIVTSTNTLSFSGATFTLQGTGALDASSGTVNYSGDRDQQIIAGTYGTLITSGSTTARTKTATGNVTLSASGSLTVGNNDTLSVTGNLNLSAAGVTLTNNNVIKMGGNATFVGTITSVGSFYYAGSGSQNIGTNTYATLRLGGSSTKTFPNGTVAVTSNYTIDNGSGSRDYTSNTSTFQFAGTSGTQTISGLSETFYILQFAGAATKPISGTSLGAARLDILATSGLVTNNVTTMTLTNISNISMTVASGASFQNNQAILFNGDIENDGVFTNAGTVTAN
ncbi:MAG: hypothetical protein V1799_13680 [bacterium]